MLLEVFSLNRLAGVKLPLIVKLLKNFAKLDFQQSTMKSVSLPLASRAWILDKFVSLEKAIRFVKASKSMFI